MPPHTYENMHAHMYIPTHKLRVPYLILVWSPAFSLCVSGEESPGNGVVARDHISRIVAFSFRHFLLLGSLWSQTLIFMVFFFFKKKNKFIYFTSQLSFPLPSLLPSPPLFPAPNPLLLLFCLEKGQSPMSTNTRWHSKL